MSLDTFLEVPVVRRRRSRRQWRMISTAFAVVVFFLVGMSVVGAWDQAANGIETDAVVVARHELKPGVVDLSVRFTTADGKSVTRKLTEYSDPEAHGVGATMRVRYTPDDLLTFQAEEPPFRLPLVIFSGLFLVVAIGTLVYAWAFAPPDQRRREPGTIG